MAARGILYRTVVVATVLVSCGESEPRHEPAGPPVSELGRHAGPLEYLLDRYDRDADGRVTPEEHGRTPRAFARLDRDGNGVIEAADFAASPPRGGRRRADRAMLLVGRFLQADGDGTRLDRKELEEAFASYDQDGDGHVDEEEFRCGQLQPAPGPALDSPGARRLLEDVDPWRGLLAGIDDDGDGRLALAELTAFHQRRGQGRTWSFEPEGEGRAERPNARPLMGRPAPDFTLPRLGGGPDVTLSSFEGEGPVALIFGSYT